ncbi:hypothetical protein Droror1_Dr00020472 [Drosera rotundifolia]
MSSKWRALQHRHRYVNHVKNVATAFGVGGGLAKAGGGRWRGVIGGCLRGLCEKYGEIGNEEKEGKRGRRFCVGWVALSIMGTPRLGYLVEVVEGCLGVVVLDLVEGLRAVVREIEGCQAFACCDGAVSGGFVLLVLFAGEVSE